MFDTIALTVGKLISTHAARTWLGYQRDHAERESQLTDLLQVAISDRFIRRKLMRQLDDIGDRIAERLAPLLEVEIPDLSPHERQAALDAVVDVLTEVDLTDSLLFSADMRADELTRLIHAKVPDAANRAGLSEPGAALFNIVLKESCAYILALVVQLPPFQPRAITELLARVTSLSQDLQLALELLPRATLDAPGGTVHDAEFATRYLSYVGQTMDNLELFGVDVHRYTPRTSVTVAYLSLTVTAEANGAKVSNGPTQWLLDTSHSPFLRDSVGVEYALSGDKRTLLRGQAGSGKTTLLQWIAVTACRGSFSGPLAAWNGKVPFMIRLRSYPDGILPQPHDFVAINAGPIAIMEPKGWTVRQFNLGNAILLIDGVDELAVDRRAKVRRWLSDLLVAYPEIDVVITSRPAAAEPTWLRNLQFTPLFLESMTPPQVVEFVHRWHSAIREWGQITGDLPCTVLELDEYEAAILRNFEGQRHLRTVATSPLLCAMLCALNLDRHKQLPPDRMKLYESALELLIERRDAEREIPVAQEIVLSSVSKVILLQHLAWWLTLSGRSEASKAEAGHQLASALQRIPDARQMDAQVVLQYLLDRSGIIREPVTGRVDFIHRTFQEYLAGKYAAEEHYVDVLVKSAHLDQWRETIIMSVGHATVPIRTAIISQVLDRASREPRHARKLRLLAGAALETARVLDPITTERIEGELSAVVPPRRRVEARSLSQVGERIIAHLPAHLRQLTPGVAAACVRTAVYVGGMKALQLLAEYSLDARYEVQRELVSGWEYWPAELYAKEVLADAPLSRTISINHASHVLNLYHLHNLRSADVFIAELSNNDLTFMAGAHPIVSFTTNIDGEVDLTPLAGLTQLHTLLFGGPGTVVGINVLPTLTGLRRFAMRFDGNQDVIDTVAECRNLREVNLHGREVDNIDLSPLENYPRPLSVDMNLKTPTRPRIKIGKNVTVTFSNWEEAGRGTASG
ncbi:MAG TPA: NACHT domain-containing protein [Pseudonocardiaceae bacterium]|nr:NACHT domain-containing protein [Pseudonocardiaceae bacterium]